MNATTRWVRRGRKAARVGQQIGWWCWAASGPLRAAMMITGAIILGLFGAACGLATVVALLRGLGITP